MDLSRCDLDFSTMSSCITGLLFSRIRNVGEWRKLLLEVNLLEKGSLLSSPNHIIARGFGPAETEYFSELKL